MTKQIFIKRGKRKPGLAQTAIKENRISCSGGSCRRLDQRDCLITNLVAGIERGIWILVPRKPGGMDCATKAPPLQELRHFLSKLSVSPPGIGNTLSTNYPLLNRLICIPQEFVQGTGSHPFLRVLLFPFLILVLVAVALSA